MQFSPVVDGRAEGVGSAGPLDAGVGTGVVGQLAVLDVGAVVIHLALQYRHTHACSYNRCFVFSYVQCGSRFFFARRNQIWKELKK